MHRVCTSKREIKWSQNWHLASNLEDYVTTCCKRQTRRVPDCGNDEQSNHWIISDLRVSLFFSVLCSSYPSLVAGKSHDVPRTLTSLRPRKYSRLANLPFSRIISSLFTLQQTQAPLFSRETENVVSWYWEGNTGIRSLCAKFDTNNDTLYTN